MDQRKHLFNGWYRRQLKNEIPQLIEKWESRIGVKVNDYGVKIMKTKWGTCNIIAKRISFGGSAMMGVSPTTHQLLFYNSVYKTVD